MLFHYILLPLTITLAGAETSLCLSGSPLPLGRRRPPDPFDRHHRRRAPFCFIISSLFLSLSLAQHGGNSLAELIIEGFILL